MNEKKEGVSKSTQGKKNRAAGVRFEARVRAEMEKMGWRMDDPHDPKMRNLPTYNPETGGLIYGDSN